VRSVRRGQPVWQLPGSYVAELWFFSTALSAADRDELYADEKAFFGLP
jgi:hypothetical protein